MNGNFNITKVSANPNGTIAELEINGSNVPLADSVKLEKKEETIDVSTYTDSIVIKPSTGKDGMTEVKITLSNIPEGE